MSDIANKVKEIIVDKLGVDMSEVNEEAHFVNDLGADSLDTVELIMEFEKEFDISIPDEDAEKIQTVGDAIKYVEEKADCWRRAGDKRPSSRIHHIGDRARALDPQSAHR